MSSLRYSKCALCICVYIKSLLTLTMILSNVVIFPWVCIPFHKNLYILDALTLMIKVLKWLETRYRKCSAWRMSRGEKTTTFKSVVENIFLLHVFILKPHHGLLLHLLPPWKFCFMCVLHTCSSPFLNTSLLPQLLFHNCQIYMLYL